MPERIIGTSVDKEKNDKPIVQLHSLDYDLQREKEHCVLIEFYCGNRESKEIGWDRPLKVYKNDGIPIDNRRTHKTFEESCVESVGSGCEEKDHRKKENHYCILSDGSHGLPLGPFIITFYPEQHQFKWCTHRELRPILWSCVFTLCILSSALVEFPLRYEKNNSKSRKNVIESLRITTLLSSSSSNWPVELVLLVEYALCVARKPKCM